MSRTDPAALAALDGLQERFPVYLGRSNKNGYYDLLQVTRDEARAILALVTAAVPTP